MGLGDVVRLSRASSQYRAVLHGFELPAKDESPRLQIGEHRTALWESLKSKSVLRCAETHHRQTKHTIRSCRICSFPVCEACVIRDSFSKPNELTFHNRSRKLCAKCWATGRHQKRQLLDQGPRECEYGLGLSGAGDVCACSARDGHLCLECKTIQNTKSADEIGKCYGEACQVSLNETELGRVCLWCNLALPDGLQRAASRRQYDIRHLHARSHSAYEQPRAPESVAKVDETKRRKIAMLLDDDRRNRHYQQKRTWHTKRSSWIKKTADSVSRKKKSLAETPNGLLMIFAQGHDQSETGFCSEDMRQQ